MKFNSKALLAAAGMAAFAFSPASATEGGLTATPPGAFIGSSAGVPPPGIYMFNQVFTVQTNLTGPGNALINPTGTKTGVQAAVDAQGFLFVPGWTFLGATYDAVIVVPWVMDSVGSPVNFQAAGLFNTYIVPAELSWKLGTSGFAVKTGLGIYLPDGSSGGFNGLGIVANPYWTFQPELIVSYLANGWNLSVAMYDEINTTNQITHYTTGNIFHADFTATKTIGNWTFGPVAYYIGQVTDDTCNVGCIGSTLLHAQRYNRFAVGGLLGYNFGPASLSIWAATDVLADAKNDAALAALGADPSTTISGTTVFATLSYRLWAPEEPAKAPMFHK